MLWYTEICPVFCSFNSEIASFSLQFDIACVCLKIRTVSKSPIRKRRKWTKIQLEQIFPWIRAYEYMSSVSLWVLLTVERKQIVQISEAIRYMFNLIPWRQGNVFYSIWFRWLVATKMYSFICVAFTKTRHISGKQL